MQTDIFTYRNTAPSSTIEGGPLTGKSAAIQPNMSVRGWPTEAGSKALERFVALENATAVERLRQAGTVIKGSTRMSELGFGLTGDTSIQAMAKNEIDFALITDTMGEARLAASRAGVFGFKPSYGIISRFGLIGLVPSMECYGILAGRLEDISAVAGVIAGNDDRDLSMPDSEIPNFAQTEKTEEASGNIGIIRECIETLNADEAKAFGSALSNIKDAGLNIKEVSLEEFELSRTVHNVIGAVEASSSSGKYDGVRYGHRTSSAKDWNDMYLRSRAESFGLLIKTYLFQGAYFQFKNYPAFKNASQIRARLLRKTEDLFNQVDVLISPTRRLGVDATTASTINEVYDAFSLTLFANVTGQPSVHIPRMVLDADTDLGLQLTGPRLGDARLLSIAAELSDLAKGGK